MSIYIKQEDSYDEIIHRLVPNWKNLTKLEWSGKHSYTVTTDSWLVVVDARSNSSGWGAELYVGSTVLIHSTGTTESNLTSIAVPVFAGDVINSNSYFRGNLQLVSLK